ncbi:MAG: lipopolysaccharide biosynthesis protein [Planctomycetes bacterium]|nr:lipopolysaccharide biosynthesis protein [Planctomycetota bacterium]
MPESPTLAPPARSPATHGTGRAAAPQPLVHKTVLSALGNLAVVGGTAVVAVVTARVLGPEGMGSLGYLTWLVAMSAVVLQLGLPASLQRYLAELHGQGRREQAEVLAHACLRTALRAGAGGAALLLAAAWAIPGLGVPGSLAPLVALLLPLQVLVETARGLWSGQQDFARLARRNLAGSVILALGVSLGALTGGVGGALVGHLAAAAATLGLGPLRLALRPARAALPPELRARLRAFARDTWLAAIVSALVWTRVEVAFLQHAWGETSVGLFTAGLSLAAFVTQFPVLLCGPLLPHLAERVALRDRAGMQRAYACATRVLGFLLLPMCLGAAAVMPVLLPLLFGAGFAPGVATAQLLVLTAAPGAIAAAGSALLYAHERSGWIFRFGLLGALLAIGGCAALVPALATEGAALARALAQSTMLAIGIGLVTRGLGFTLPWRSLGRSLVAGLACAGAAAGILALLPGCAGLAVAIVAGGLVHVLASRVLGALEGDDLQALDQALRYVPAPLRGLARGLLCGAGGAGR